MSIEYKSTGFLIDENITTDLKLEHLGERPDIRHRKDELSKVLDRRLREYNIFNDNELQRLLYSLTQKLRQVLTKCWDAQDTVMEYGELINDTIDNGGYDPDYFERCAYAAVEAQQLNAERNKLIRQIDELLGEAEFTQLEKSYG